MKVKILGSAQNDLIEGFYFYEQQEKGVGTYFIDSLFADIDSLKFYSGIHSKFLNYYRMLSKRFPFAIYYRLKKDNVLVYAVLDCRRDPA